ncbi:hypothetical protein ACE939_00705 [Aquimarina sp. W85]|uniref:hypothetical protein n=1 Tax=Aquimarina rhodophyticola TaxID=3342246 RepID=UPI0036701547
MVNKDSSSIFIKLTSLSMRNTGKDKHHKDEWKEVLKDIDNYIFDTYMEEESLNNQKGLDALIKPNSD